jgi:hypothetical protein
MKGRKVNETKETNENKEERHETNWLLGWTGTNYLWSKAPCQGTADTENR